MRHPEAVPAAAPVRVLMYTAYLPPEYSGAALQALTLARELRRRGHHVEFVTNRWPGVTARESPSGDSAKSLRIGSKRPV